MPPYAFRKGPQFTAADRGAQFEAAFEQPLNGPTTFAQGMVGGALESFGLGTVIRDFAIPQGADVPADPNAPRFNIGPEDAAVAIYGGIRDLFNPPSSEPAMTEDTYKASPFFRSNIPYDPSMTADRAAALAIWDDAKKVREHFAGKSPVTSFFGNLAGQALDPINYIPVAGPAVKAAAVGKFGMIAGSIAVGALDAAANTAVAGALTAGARAQYGDDVSWQRQISEVATAALIGAAFGGVGGFFEGRRASSALVRAEAEAATLRTTQEARLALNGGIRDLGLSDSVNLLPNEIDPVAKQAEIRQRRNAEIAAVDLTPEIEANATARLQSVGYDLRQIPAADEVEAIMQQAPIAEAAKAFEVQNLRFAEGRAEDLAKEVPEVNAYGPGLYHRPDLAPNAQVYGGRWGKARSVDEYRTEVAQAKADIESISQRIEKGEPSKEAVDMVTTGRQWAQERRQQAGQGSAPQQRAVAVDASPARPPQPPDGRSAAAGTAGRPDDAKALAAQYGVDPKSGDFVEQTDIDQLMGQGRISEADEAELAAADETFERANSYGQALITAARCMVA